MPQELQIMLNKFCISTLSIIFILLFEMPSVAEDTKIQSEINKGPIQQAKLQKARVGEIEIAYYTRGEGKPLFMIIGYDCTMSMWDPALLEILEKKYQLILFDNRGAGLSNDSSENQTSIPQMADDTAGLIKALGFFQAYVLGWSMGANIAQQLAIKHPEVVEKLVLCAPSPGGRNQILASGEILNKLNSYGLDQDEKLTLLFSENDQGKAASKAYKERINEAKAKGTIPNDFYILNATAARQTYARSVLWNKNEENYNALSSIKIPTLVIGGQDDFINPPENVKVIANRIPLSWSAYIPGGHAFMFQESKKFTDLLFLFLE